MRKVTLFIAMSLDGYIADNQGKVDWLEGQGEDTENIDSYFEFVKEIDTVIMGWNTYNQIVTELSPDEWIYNELTTYVMTHRKCISSEKINFIDMDLVELVKRLRVENGKGIWICGGANVIHQLVNQDMIDCYDITIIPTLLGAGIRLFEASEKEMQLKLLKTQCHDGMIDLTYVRR